MHRIHALCAGGIACKRSRAQQPLSTLSVLANSALTRQQLPGPSLASAAMTDRRDCGTEVVFSKAPTQSCSSVQGTADENIAPVSSLRLKLPGSGAQPDRCATAAGGPEHFARRSVAGTHAAPLTFAELAALPCSMQFQATCAASDPKLFAGGLFPEPHGLPLRPSTPTRPPSLAVASEPSSIANLSPSLLRTPPTSRPECPPSNVRLQPAPVCTRPQSSMPRLEQLAPSIAR